MTVQAASPFPKKRLKHVVSLRRSRVDGNEDDRPYLGLEHMESWTGALLRDSSITTVEGTSLSNAFESGDVLFGKLRPYLAKVWVAKFAGQSTTECLVMKPVEVEPRFLGYVCLSRDFIDRVDASTFGSKMPRADWDFVGNMPVPVPEVFQQRAIADYLDRETARLDALVAAKERMLDLLTEKRVALITNAVTRGLDPDVPLRDSGIPWLGDIPVHWALTRLKFVGQVQTGLALGKAHPGPVVDYPYLRVANVQDGFLDLSEVKTVSIPVRETQSYLLRTGDVLMTEGGDADKLGRGCVWSGAIDPCLHQNHVFAVRMEGVAPDWLALWMSGAHAKAYLESRSKQSTNLASISSSNLMEMPLTKPSDEEQTTVVGALDCRVRDIDRACKEVERSMVILKERRAALIAAAVTGRIDISVIS